MWIRMLRDYLKSRQTSVNRFKTRYSHSERNYMFRIIKVNNVGVYVSMQYIIVSNLKKSCNRYIKAINEHIQINELTKHGSSTSHIHKSLNLLLALLSYPYKY
jgi:hypothetical protein